MEKPTTNDGKMAATQSKPMSAKRTGIETASTAAAATARALVSTRYEVAMARPRSLDAFRSALMRECQRPAFARVARYHKPIGKGVEGFSIRFAEACARLMGNLLLEAPVVYEDEYQRKVTVSVTDLEANIVWVTDVVVEKTVERSNPSDRFVIGQRTNTQGKITYLVAATEDDLLNKQAALVSKAFRTGILRVVPGDFLDEAKREVLRINADAAAKDPDAERKRIADLAMTVNVTVKDLAAYLGHPWEKISPAGLLQIEMMLVSIVEGEVTWQEILDMQRAARAGDRQPTEAPPPPPPPTPTRTATETSGPPPTPVDGKAMPGWNTPDMMTEPDWIATQMNTPAPPPSTVVTPPKPAPPEESPHGVAPPLEDTRTPAQRAMGDIIAARFPRELGRIADMLTSTSVDVIGPEDMDVLRRAWAEAIQRITASAKARGEVEVLFRIVTAAGKWMGPALLESSRKVVVERGKAFPKEGA